MLRTRNRGKRCLTYCGPSCNCDNRSELNELLEKARKLPPMTKEQMRTQARSFVIGQMGLMKEYSHLTRKELEKIVDEALERSVLF